MWYRVDSAAACLLTHPAFRQTPAARQFFAVDDFVRGTSTVVHHWEDPQSQEVAFYPTVSTQAKMAARVQRNTFVPPNIILEPRKMNSAPRNPEPKFNELNIHVSGQLFSREFLQALVAEALVPMLARQLLADATVQQALLEVRQARSQGAQRSPRDTAQIGANTEALRDVLLRNRAQSQNYDYESTALTAELRALQVTVNCSNNMRTNRSATENQPSLVLYSRLFAIIRRL